jgi:hypothetical protein
VLERVAANPHHTPALYSTFLRALISARADPTGAQSTTVKQAPAEDSALGDLPSGMLPHGFLGVLPGNPSLGNNDFRFDGEMGPVADMSTFPPTMATPTDDPMGMLSMDSIFSQGFWDNVLVPGKHPHPFSSIICARSLI